MEATHDAAIEDRARTILAHDFWAIEEDACSYLYRVRIARDRAALKALEHADNAAAIRANVYDRLADIVEAEYL